MEDEQELWKDYKSNFEGINPSLFDKITALNAEITDKDLKHCSYVISKFSPKEVAKMLNVSVRSVETARYRIKKKLNLQKDDSLYAFIKNL